MNAISAAESDPVRRNVLAAMDRLLSGVPLRSTGRLSVSQLAVEAGVKRWHLTHQHIDLKDLFQARVLANESNVDGASEYENLKQKYDELRLEYQVLERRLQGFASVINLLTLEKLSIEQSDTLVSIDANRPRPRD